MLALCIDFKYNRVMQTVNDTGHAFSKYYAWPTFYFFAPVGSLFLALYLFINTIRDPFPDYQELGILDNLSSLIAIGWTSLAVLLVCYFGGELYVLVLSFMTFFDLSFASSLMILLLSMLSNNSTLAL